MKIFYTQTTFSLWFADPLSFNKVIFPFISTSSPEKRSDRFVKLLNGCFMEQPHRHLINSHTGKASINRDNSSSNGHGIPHPPTHFLLCFFPRKFISVTVGAKILNGLSPLLTVKESSKEL
jgi:hypothetical protein